MTERNKDTGIETELPADIAAGSANSSETIGQQEVQTLQQAPQNAFSQVGGAQASYQEDSPQENLPQKGAQAESASDSASDSAAESAEDVIAELNAMAYKEASALDYLPRPIGSLRKNRHPALTLFIGMLIIFLIFFFVAARMVFGKGWIVNMIEGNDNFRSFTIPIVDHPEIEDMFYQEDGRYTVEGVANVCSESIVTIESFEDSSVFAAYGQGSGIIMTEDGYIITNAHVIQDAELAIIVRLNDGTEYNATVVGSDAKSDVAVIKINATGLTPAQFGDSSKLSLGEQVVALGSPAGLECSVTTGVVSGMNRMVQLESTSISMNCIQIDAAINPGNSGGALFNMWGQVVGITSSKIEGLEFENVGFAISMEAAKPIIEELIENGSVLGRPKIGISFYEVSDSVASVYGIPAGLHIAEISPDCDIANTELQINDVITAFNGVEVRSVDEVQKIIMSMSPGDEVTATVTRIEDNGDLTEFEISFKLMSDDTASIQPKDNLPPLPDSDAEESESE